MIPTILGRSPSFPRTPSGSQTAVLSSTANFSGNGSPSKGTGAVDEIPGSRLRAHLSDETTAVWERLSNECACQCDWGCASCEPEETAEWRRV